MNIGDLGVGEYFRLLVELIGRREGGIPKAVAGVTMKAYFGEEMWDEIK